MRKVEDMNACFPKSQEVIAVWWRRNSGVSSTYTSIGVIMVPSVMYRSTLQNVATASLQNFSCW